MLSRAVPAPSNVLRKSTMHRIKLHGPWDLSWPELPKGTQTGRIRVPFPCPVTAAQLPAGESVNRFQQFKLSRLFHSPTGLVKGQRLTLRVETLVPVAEFVLNNLPIPVVDRHRISLEIQDKIEFQNRLELLFPVDSGWEQALLKLVCLEIDP